MVHAGKRSQVPRGGWMPLRWAQPPSYSEDSSRRSASRRSVVICVCLLGDALASAFRVGGFLPRWCIRSSVRAGTAVRRGKGPGMHSNLAPISRHPPCGKLSCMHHDLAQSPQSRDGGVGGGGWFNACFRIPRLSRSRVTVHDRYLSRSPGIMSRSPPFLRQLVARLNAGHGVGAGDVRHDVGPARGLGHGLVDAHLASVQLNPVLLGCHGPRAGSRARSWHRSRRPRGSSDSPGRSHESRAHGSC